MSTRRLQSTIEHRRVAVTDGGRLRRKRNTDHIRAWLKVAICRDLSESGASHRCSAFCARARLASGWVDGDWDLFSGVVLNGWTFSLSLFWAERTPLPTVKHAWPQPKILESDFFGLKSFEVASVRWYDGSSSKTYVFLYMHIWGIHTLRNTHMRNHTKTF